MQASSKAFVVQMVEHHIKMMDSDPHERLCVQTANPNADGCYWDLLHDTITMYKIRPETTFKADEIGFQSCDQDQALLLFLGRKNKDSNPTGGCKRAKHLR